MRGDAQALRQLFHLAKPLVPPHPVSRHIAHRDIAAFGNQLAREFAAHARAAPGDDSDLSGKILHGRSLTFPLQYCEILVGARGLEPPTSSFPVIQKRRLSDALYVSYNLTNACRSMVSCIPACVGASASRCLFQREDFPGCLVLRPAVRAGV